MARWDSICVLTYLKNAPLEHITTQYIVVPSSYSGHPSPGSNINTLALNKFSNKVIQQLNSLRADAIKHEEERKALGAKHATLEPSALPKYIISDISQMACVCLVYLDV